MAEPAALVWTTPALDDLDDIAAFIALENESAAAALVEKVFMAVARLRRFPASGRRVPELGRSVYREVIVPPCRILYRRERGAVLIVHVVRSERQLRSDFLR